MNITAPWLRQLKPFGRHLTEVVCFPHSGGAASAFRALAAELDGDMGVVGVQYPGRQDRYEEPPITDLHELADQIAGHLSGPPRHRIFFGHSMGAILAYEVAQRLGPMGPTALIASARPAPSVVEATTSYLLDDGKLIEQVVRLGGTAAAVFENDDMRGMLLAVIRGDYQASETYRPRGGPPLNCPIVAMGGIDDPTTSVDELRAWSAHTTGGFRLELMQGGHFYLQDSWPAIARLLRSAVPMYRGCASFAGVFTDIETTRLILRPLCEDDRSTMVELHTDPRTTRFQSNPPGAAQVDLLFDSWLEHWAEHGFGYCAVTTRSSSDVVGLTGIRVRDFHGEAVLNLGYRFRPEVWGRGYATEAAQAIVNFRARELPMVPMVASVNKANESSVRVAERIGFTDYTEEFYDGAPSRHYRLGVTKQV
ncbi:GNAT family N-acetyltransferase [Rhodococcoides yunnanense]|uniref:Thioesterase TesA n=1 Tax=Rhodococcoides yunnanense TaxID=278209 RepID=A0ABU4BI85_9NOCA|nr:GNAT family N-acetyltransferase [Rhodococcus yunnanensis]MDV6263920.1 GNAT family N-acetyltransferase [Rhodococcus yunnanensis]